MLDGRDYGLTFPLEKVGFLDFESRSSLSVATAGTYRYATEADAIVLSYALGDRPAATVTVGSFSEGPLQWGSLPDEIKRWHALVAAGAATWAAWNAGFDKAIWNYSTVGFPVLQPRHIIDVMAQAVASGLPPDLEGAALRVGGARKDKAGVSLIRLFCLPGAEATPQSHPKEWGQLARYAETDVTATRSVFMRTRQLSHAEWREYWALEAVNETGIGIDVALAQRASQLADEDRFRSRGELARLTEGTVLTVDQVARLTDWLLPRVGSEGSDILTKREEELGENGETVRPAKHALTRRHVERLLALPGLDDSLRRALQIRLYGGSRTPAKFSKMLQQHVDGVLYGQYVFNGAAQTGRASSKGVQIHNLARDCLVREHATIEAILSGCDHGWLAHVNPDPVARQLSLLIRPALVPVGERNVFVWSDWSQIEARVLPWLAGADKGAQARLDAFKAVDENPALPDLYVRTAAAISSIPVETVTPATRQRGKVAELALGFGGNIGSLQTMGAAYGLHMGDDEARRTVDRWRKANQWCVTFWGRLEHAATSALKLPHVPFPAGRITYIYLPSYLNGSLLCQLPSGRCLVYRDIRHEDVDEEDVDGNVKRVRQLRCARAYGRVKLWKGMFCENVVQAVAADILRGTLVRLIDAGFRVRATTHDEVLVETNVEKALGVASDLGKIMRLGCDWSAGLPLMSEEIIAPYYSKSKSMYYTNSELTHATASRAETVSAAYRNAPL